MRVAAEDLHRCPEFQYEYGGQRKDGYAMWAVRRHGPIIAV